jgi:hypothetical protein
VFSSQTTIQAFEMIGRACFARLGKQCDAGRGFLGAEQASGSFSVLTIAATRHNSRI